MICVFKFILRQQLEKISEAAERLRQMPQDLQRRVLDLGDLRCPSHPLGECSVEHHVGLIFLVIKTPPCSFVKHEVFRKVPTWLADFCGGRL